MCGVCELHLSLSLSTSVFDRRLAHADFGNISNQSRSRSNDNSHGQRSHRTQSMKLANSSRTGALETKEKTSSADRSRVSPTRTTGRDASPPGPTRANKSPPKTGDGGKVLPVGTVVTVNGCPPKNSSVIYLSAECSSAIRTGQPCTGIGLLVRVIKTAQSSTCQLNVRQLSGQARQVGLLL